jgi:hypothetical protein
VDIFNVDGSASNDESDFTRSVRELTDLIGELQAKHLTAADRAILRSLLDELEAFRAHSRTGESSRIHDETRKHAAPQ